MEISRQSQAALRRLDPDQNGVSAKELNTIQQDNDPKISPAEAQTAGIDPKDLSAINPKLTASMDPNQVLFERPAKGSSEDLALDFLAAKNKMVYSQNLGFLDGGHVPFYFKAYRQAYAAAQKAVVTGQPQTLTIKAGNHLTHHEMTFEIQPDPQHQKPEDLRKLARSLVASASYRYEANSVLMNGAGNWVGESVGMGQSAFSTEDLSSNALGIWAAEKFVQEHGDNPYPPGVSEDQAQQSGLNRILDAAGPLQSEASAKLKRTSFGNDEFTPKRSTTEAPDNPAGLEAMKFLTDLNSSAKHAYGDGSVPVDPDHFEDKETYYPKAGPGWTLTGTKGSIIGNALDSLNPF